MAEKKLRIVFMGTPDFALTALKAIDASVHDVIGVYSQPPRPKGRGHKLQPSPVQAYAQNHDIPVFCPKSLKSEEAQVEFAALQADVTVVAAYGLLLPKAVLDAPKYGCINIHASLLPRWRGASPIQRAIWEGDKESGVTLMQMDEGLDTGPEIMKKSIPLDESTTASSLHDELATMGGEMIVETLDLLAKNSQLSVKEQENEGVSYAHLLKKEDGRVNWKEGADEIDRQIRALNPWPGVWAEIEGVRFKILEARPIYDQESPQSEVEEKNRPVGMLLDKQGRVQCSGDTILHILKLQPAGKQAMDFAGALNGGYLAEGQIFS